MTTATVRAPAELATRGAIDRNLRTIWMIWVREILRFRRSPARVVSSLAQPFLFLFVFGIGLSPLFREQGAATFDYKKFLFPGVVAMSVLFSAVFSAISIVWDREFGFLREMLVAPVSRTSLVVGKAIGGGTVAVFQGVIIVAAAPIIGVSLSPIVIVKLLGLMTLLAFALTAFGIVIASRMQRMEAFQVVMSLVVNPMFFLSGAMFPLNNLPGWLAAITRLNPMTYAVDAMRRVLATSGALQESGGQAGIRFGNWEMPIMAEIAVVAALGVGMLAIAVRSFQKTE